MELDEQKIDEFTLGYIYSALWELNETLDLNSEKNYDINNVAQASLDMIAKECKIFQENNKELLEKFYSTQRESGTGNFLPEHAGYDFWITRNKKQPIFWNQLEIQLARSLIKEAKKSGNHSIIEKNGVVHFSTPSQSN